MEMRGTVQVCGQMKGILNTKGKNIHVEADSKKAAGV